MNRSIHPTDGVDCSQQHLFEVITTVDLYRTMPQSSSTQQLSSAADSVCLSEWRSYTGLPGPNDEVWPTTLFTSGGVPPQAFATCVVATRYPHVGSAQAVAR